MTKHQKVIKESEERSRRAEYLAKESKASAERSERITNALVRKCSNKSWYTTKICFFFQIVTEGWKFSDFYINFLSIRVNCQQSLYQLD